MNALRKVFSSITNTPSWVWGLVAGAGSVIAVWLRLRSAEKKVLEAETRATEARLERDGAKEDATVELELERTEDLERQREQIRAEAEVNAAAMQAMSDEDVTQWIRRDAEQRRKNEP